MIVHKLLNEIFSTYSNVAVLRAMQDNRQGLSGREISKKAELSAPSCFQALKKLERLKLVARQKGGRDHLFTLNFDNVALNEAIIPVLEFERNWLNRILGEIKKNLKNDSLSLILFGSVARSEENYESDFDVAIILKELKNNSKLDDKVTKLSLQLNKNFGISLSSISLSLSDFKKRAKKNLPPVNNILIEGFVFSGLSIRKLLDD
jgi:predicted nucleotidyltransferase